MSLKRAIYSARLLRVGKRQGAGLAVGLIVVLYGFTASYAIYRYPIGFLQAVSPYVWIQVLQGAIDGMALGVLLPETILTPVILLAAFLRARVSWVLCWLGLGLGACCIGSALGATGPQYLTPFWSIVVGFAFNAPILILWSTLLYVVVSKSRRREPTA